MKKFLSIIGIALSAIGILLGVFATAAHLATPIDPSGAGAKYDESVEGYNKQLAEFATANPALPVKPNEAKTILQAHQEDTLFWMLVAGVTFFVGLGLCYFNRSPQTIAGMS